MNYREHSIDIYERRKENKKPVIDGIYYKQTRKERKRSSE